MKAITTILILFCSINLCSAQKAQLSKEETVKYINDLYKSSYTAHSSQIESVVLDGKTLVITYNDGDILRHYLMEVLPLNMTKSSNDKFYISDKIRTTVFGHIVLENDAKRLKNALEHLIEILKAEPETDPFGN